jgi:hypothetical protein
LFSDVRSNKDRSGCKTLLEEIKSSLGGNGPLKARLDRSKGCERGCHLTEITNETPIEIRETEKALQLDK